MTGNLINRKSRNGSDFYQTPAYAVELLLPFLDPLWTVWEPVSGQGMLAHTLRERIGRVVTTDIDPISDEVPFDFLADEPNFNFDCIVTNPPFSQKDSFLEKCYEYRKPFALLMPLTALEGKRRHKSYTQRGIQLIVPDARISFYDFEGVYKDKIWFHSAWFTWGLLPEQLVFVKLEKKIE